MSFVLDEKKLSDNLRIAVQKLIDDNKEDVVVRLLKLVDILSTAYDVKISLEPKIQKVEVTSNEVLATNVDGFVSDNVWRSGDTSPDPTTSPRYST